VTVSNPAVRIVALSDTHGKHDQVTVPEGDILIHAGDFMDKPTSLPEATSFLRWFSQHPHRVKILVAGNHDGLFEMNPVMMQSFVPTNVVYLEHQRYEALGIKFFGSPFTPYIPGWSFMKQRGDSMMRLWRQIPIDTDVLITHGPANGYRDRYKGFSVGCEALRYVTDNIRQPLAHVFGHIHSDYGYTNLKTRDGHLFNVAALDVDGNPTNPPIVFDVTFRNVNGRRRVEKQIELIGPGAANPWTQERLLDGLPPSEFRARYLNEWTSQGKLVELAANVCEAYDKHCDSVEEPDSQPARVRRGFPSFQQIRVIEIDSRYYEAKKLGFEGDITAWRQYVFHLRKRRKR
jgi:Icc-related predicted phosphoesterase